MSKYTEWLHTGETEDGKLKIWCKIDTFEDVKYIKMKYTDFEDNRIGEVKSYPVNNIKLLNSLIYAYRMEYGHDV